MRAADHTQHPTGGGAASSSLPPSVAEVAALTRRLRALLDGLIEDTPSVRHAAVREQLALLDDAISRAHPDPAEQAVARVADHVGLGGHATGPAG